MTSDDYRAKAEEMRKSAAFARDPEVRSTLLALAHDWERLAKDSDELARRIARQTAKPGRW
jgi:hypothetical protein